MPSGLSITVRGTAVDRTAYIYTHTHISLLMVVPVTPLLQSFSVECLETVGKTRCAASLPATMAYQCDVYCHVQLLLHD